MHSIKKETNESDINNYLNLDSVKDEIVEVQIKSELVIYFNHFFFIDLLFFIDFLVNLTTSFI